MQRASWVRVASLGGMAAAGAIGLAACEDEPSGAPAPRPTSLPIPAVPAGATGAAERPAPTVTARFEPRAEVMPRAGARPVVIQRTTTGCQAAYEGGGWLTVPCPAVLEEEPPGETLERRGRGLCKLTPFRRGEGTDGEIPCPADMARAARPADAP